MAGGWARDGAEQDQIDATISDAIERARRALEESTDTGETLECEECGALIPEARRQAIKGVKYCIHCQQKLEQETQALELFNRRGSKDSQLR